MRDTSNECNISNFKVIKSITINNVTIELFQYSNRAYTFRFIPSWYKYTYVTKRLNNKHYVVVWRDVNSKITYIPFSSITLFSKANTRFNLLVKTIQLNKTQFVKL